MVKHSDSCQCISDYGKTLWWNTVMKHYDSCQCISNVTNSVPEWILSYQINVYINSAASLYPVAIGIVNGHCECMSDSVKYLLTCNEITSSGYEIFLPN